MPTELIQLGPRPKVDENSKTDRTAMNAVERLFLEHGSHQLEIPGRDFGRDGRLVFRFEGGGAAGYSTSLQVKGTRSAEPTRFKAFVWPVPRKTLIYLSDCPAPAYLVFHYCGTGATYVREVHELCDYLDHSRRGWRQSSADDISVTVQVSESRLDAKRVRRIEREARAWAMERRTMRAEVERLQKKIARVGIVKSEARLGAREWRTSGGGIQRRTKGEMLSVPDVLYAFLFSAAAQHVGYLCDLYWERQAAAMMPHQLVKTSRGGILDLPETWQQLISADESLAKLRARVRDIAWTPATEEQRDTLAPPQQAPAPLALPDLTRLSASAAATIVATYLRQLGLVVSRGKTEHLDLVVDCGRARGLLSLAVFGSQASRARVEAVRMRLRTAGAVVGATLLKHTQGDELKLHLWPEARTPREPPIPLGTDAPTLDTFIGQLLRKCFEMDGWSQLPQLGTTLRPECEGFALSMLNKGAPGTETAATVQRAVVRGRAIQALDCVQASRPFYFAFHWGVRRMDVYGISSPADLMLFTLRGPAAFFDAGGHTLRSSLG